jgi:hypothetical protein
MTTGMERDTVTSGGANGSPQGQQLQEAATGLVEQAARTADAQASTTMTRVGETLETVAGHIREAGQELRPEQPQIAGLIETAAERVEEAATYLRDRDASEALANVQRIARSQPALVIGGGLAAGLIVGRILRGGAETATAGNAGSGSFGEAYSGTARGTYSDSSSSAAADRDLFANDVATGRGSRDDAVTAKSTKRPRS